MNIAIIGAGISGLTAAYELTKAGHDVTVFEKSPEIGGLGAYVKVGGTYIERYYHHFFQTDSYIVGLAEEFGLSEKLNYYSAKTGVVYQNRIYPFSGAVDLLTFGPLPFIDRIRCSATAAFSKFTPFDMPFLDTVTAQQFMKRWSGDKVYQTIWGPLLKAKFANYADSISMEWLRERIRDRSPKLGYFDGSVSILFEELVKRIKHQGGKLKPNSEVKGITKTKKGIEVQVGESTHVFDQVIIAAVSPIALRLIKSELPEDYKKRLASIDHIGAVCVIVELKHSIQSHYWLSVCDPKAPVLAVVEHTNMLPKEWYNNHSVVYLANYLHRSTDRFKQSDTEIIEEYTKYLKTLNPRFDKSWIINAVVSKAPFAQTVFPTGYRDILPPIETPIQGIYMVNIDQMYPHDRTLNQGIELGKKVAAKILLVE